MTKHLPEIRELTEGLAMGCTCGFEDPALWSTKLGARGAFLQHVVDEAITKAKFPGEAFVDYYGDDT